MIAEFGIIPDVFDPAGYPSPEVCDLRLGQLKDILLRCSVIRNFRSGEWLRHMNAQSDRWHPHAREFLEVMEKQSRMRPFAPCGSESPTDAQGWCREALASHDREPLRGIIADEGTAAAHPAKSVISAVSKLALAPWWQNETNSVELRRMIADYLKALNPVLKHSNSLMFIDPHLDPSQRRYGDFPQILKACGSSTSRPLVEIHRVWYIGSGNNIRYLSKADCQTMFEPLRQALAQRGVKAEAFIWDEFHDRYLISDLIGIAIPNGFDVDTRQPTVTRWTRLDQKHKDNIQREFDPAARQHELKYRFAI